MDIFTEEEFKKYVSELYKMNNGELAISGIKDMREDVELTNLNEGITTYKQEMYDGFLGNQFHTGYVIQKDVAKFLGESIGKEELISMHFNNDYKGLRNAFKDKTGNELDDLVLNLNESVEKLNKHKMLPYPFRGMYTKRIYQKMEDYMNKIKKDKESKTMKSKENKFREDLSKDAPSFEEQAWQSKEIQTRNEIIDNTATKEIVDNQKD